MTEETIEFTNQPKDLVLDYYHCTFFLPLIGIREEDLNIKENYRQHYCPTNNEDLEKGEQQAFLYFTPTIRNILFDCDKNEQGLIAVKEWRLKQSLIKDWELHLGKDHNKDKPESYQEAKITSVKLFQYFNGIYILAFKVNPKALLELKIKKPDSPLFNNKEKINLEALNNQDPENKHLYQQLTMENWLHFTRLTRLLYPVFPQQSDEDKIRPISLIRPGRNPVIAFKEKIETIEIPRCTGEHFSPVIIAILESFSNTPQNINKIFKDYNELYDDRMFVSVAYGIAGKILPDKDIERLNYLVSYVDRQEDLFDNPEEINKEVIQNMKGCVYTPDYIQKRMKNNSFAMWQGLGGYYTYTDFSNTYLSTGWDFRTYIAPEHIPHIYDRMLIQALFYQGSLRYYDSQICTSTKELLDKGKHGYIHIREQRKKFIEFTNQYWFHKLTEQMQGKEIFSLQQKALELQEHYEIIKDELERTDEYILTEHEINETRFNSNIAYIGIPLAISAIYYSVLPLLESTLKKGDATLWERTGNWVNQYLTNPSLEPSTTGLLTYFILPPAIIFLISWIIKKKG